MPEYANVNARGRAAEARDGVGTVDNLWEFADEVGRGLVGVAFDRSLAMFRRVIISKKQIIKFSQKCFCNVIHFDLHR